MNGSNLYPSIGYLYYNGNDWEFNTPTISGGGGGVVDTDAITEIVNNTIKNVSWWGQTINNNKVDGNIVITKGSHSFTIELDDNGNLKFNGNIYATGGITAFGSSGSISGGGSGGSTTGTLYFGAPNKNLGFNGSKDMYLAFGDGLKVEKLDSQITVSAIGGGTSGSGVALSPTMAEMNNQLGKTTLNTPQFLYWDGSTYTWKNESEISGGSGSSGSSGTTAGRLRFYKDSSEESWNGESDFKIIFGSGLNVTWDSHSQITLSATGGSGGSTSTSVSWTDVTNKPSVFTPSSHTHPTSEITGLSNFKVNNATYADRLLNSRTIWGQSFNGTSDINGNLKMGSAGGGSIQLWMNNGNMLDRTNNTLHIGYALKSSSDGEINLDAYKTVVYTDNMSKHYDFKSNVFDVNSNQIHFGSETNGGKIYWDAANNAFKIEGNVYATGGITALGVSNNATTSNNVDFTFRSVTANTFNVKNSIQLSNSLSLVKYGNDVYLGSTDVSNPNYIYLDGMDQNYYLDSQGDAYFNSLDCDVLNFTGASNFEIVDANDVSFAIQFTYNNKTYRFTPSSDSVTVS